MKKQQFIILSTVLLFVFQGIQAQSYEEWCNDADFLVQKYESIYPDFGNSTDSAGFYALLEDVKASFDPKNRDDNIIKLFKLHASLHDAHSIPMVFHPCFDLHSFPLRIHKFREGWFVTDVLDGYNDLVGMQVVAVQGVPIDDIFEHSDEIIASENLYGKLDRFEMFGIIAEWLKAEKIIPDIKSADFEFAGTDGNKVFRTIQSVPFMDVFSLINMSVIPNTGNFALFNPREDFYWYDWDSKTGTLYFQFNAVNNQEGKPTIEDFTADLRKILKRKPVKKFIIDLRNNAGGDDSNLPPLLEVIRNSKKINQYGKLFVITGPHTFSSGLLFAWQLRMQTEALFVGEPAAQGPVFNANAEYVFLPNSKIGFTISKTSTARNQPHWVFTPPKVLEVDIPVDYSVSDFLQDNDPALSEIASFNSSNACDLPRQFPEGRYILSNLHVMELKRIHHTLFMDITDFMNTGLFHVRKRICYDEENGIFHDQNNLFTIAPIDPNENILKVTYNGEDVEAERMTEDQMIAFEAMTLRKYSEAVKLFSANAEEFKMRFMKFEYYLTMAGYEMLSAGDIQNSLQIFELLTEIYPQSWNAYDSYGEALVQAGKTDEAIANFKRSLELNPENENGKKWLIKISDI